jgi:hypothetical protein
LETPGRAHLYGKGQPQESYEDMATNFPLAIHEHFYQNTLNGIHVEGATYMDGPTGPMPLDLVAIEQTLNVRGGKTMVNRARQHYLTLLFNLASGKLLTQGVVSEDGRTVSQAIQDIADRINNGDPADDELAKDIAEMINESRTVPAGMIRDEFSSIAYRQRLPQASGGFALHQNSPNPFNPMTQIRFDLPADGPYVISVYNAAGRLVDRVSGQGTRGRNDVLWGARDGTLASGMYICRLEACGRTESRRMTLPK